MTQPENDNITRRRALGAAGAVGAGIVASRFSGPAGLLSSLDADTAEAAVSSCVLTPARTEGPYFVDEKLNRSDIRSDPSTGTVEDGVPLELTFAIVRADGDCAPVAGATVDVWHANADGVYSDVGQNAKKFLRGHQVTDSSGAAVFTTIYPGWYMGRAIHIHYKVRLFDGSSETYEFTSQLFFDPSVTSDVVKTSAYDDRGTPDTSNSSDGIYGSDGDTLIVPLTSDGGGGYKGTFVVGLAGLPATGDDVVDAGVSSVTFVRRASGARVLRIKVKADETVTATARLTRDGKTIVRKKGTLRSGGTRTLNVNVPTKAARGSAQLVLRVQDAGGTSKTIKRTVSVPRRAS